MGTDRVLPTGARLVRPFRHVTITLGTPISTAELGCTRSTNTSRRDVTDRVMSEVRRLCGQTYVDDYAPTSSPHT